MRLVLILSCLFAIAGCHSRADVLSAITAADDSHDAGDHVAIRATDAAVEQPVVAADAAAVAHADAAAVVHADAAAVANADAAVVVDIDAAAIVGIDAAMVANADAAMGADTDASVVADADAGADAGAMELSRVVDWSVRKRLTTSTGVEMCLEEMLTGLADASPKPSRIVVPASDELADRSWTAPEGSYISDFCVHPSGQASVVLLGAGGSVSLVRLNQELVLIETVSVHDPAIANDPHVSDAGALDLVANQLILDGARIGNIGEDVVAAVFSSWNSVITYRASFSNGHFSEPARTLVEPPTGLTPNLPIGGSFDAFGAMTAWFRCLLDVDEDGNAYVALWAGARRIRDHVAFFADGLTPLPGDPSAPQAQDADVLLTKLDPGGARVWSRVVGTEHEDEPYALRARRGEVAVVGRARRLPGFDNSFWDAFIAVTSSDGEPRGVRSIELEASSIALAVDSFADAGWVLGGSDGWTQNPSGLSILSFGGKLLLKLPSLTADPVRVTLPPGPRHNEIRTLQVDATRIAFGGHEDGPITHTGDGDPNQIHATGVRGTIAR